MSEEIKINKYDESITFANNGIAFSQFGIAKEILDLIEDLQQKVEQLEKELNTTNDLLHKANDEVVSYCNRCIELENIRKRMIEYIENKNLEIPKKVREKAFDILNKGSDKE